MNISKKGRIIITLSVLLLFFLVFIRNGTTLYRLKDSILVKTHMNLRFTKGDGNNLFRHSGEDRNPGFLNEKVHEQTDEFIFPYTFTHPSMEFSLPQCLDEISGLFYFEPNRLICIQDEKGKMYVFDIDKGKVTKKIKFSETSDYEDIVVVKDTVYVLQSNGNIVELRNFKKVSLYNTKLSNKNNAEGLAFDPERNLLLIACKDSPHLKKKRNELKGKKAVYGFDLGNKSISPQPVYVIDEELLKDHRLYPSKRLSLLGFIKDAGLLKREIDFSPSGIAVHPKTGDIYLISSTAQMLIVLNQNGEIIAAEEFDKRIFRQPEGICFSPDGDMFISNEKKGKGRANILRFDYKG
ncbi:SdiA-regulated domain-containing protein [bacterium]|nr:SdiA-regulated domain-containing protein [bacterium]